jgi:hypothetical protein
MKCANPACNHGIGLVSYRRGLFAKQRYCSKQCRDRVAVDSKPRMPKQRRAATYFEWLFMQPAAPMRPRLAMAPVHVRRYG